MKKCVHTFFIALLLALVMVTPAIATGMNANEQSVYDELSAILDKYDEAHGGWLESSRVKQYREEFRLALLSEHVNLDETASGEISNTLQKVDQILTTCDSLEDAQDHHDEISGLVNGVARRYNMRISLSELGQQAHTVVKQTGPVFRQTPFVAFLAAIALCVTVLSIKKSKLFA